MNFDDQVPVLVLHILEAYISKNARIVDQDINPSKLLYGGFDDLFTISHIVVVGNGFTACCSDLVDDNISGLFDREQT